MSETLVKALERARMEVTALVSSEDGRYTVVVRNDPERHRTAIKTQLDKISVEWIGSRYDVERHTFKMVLRTREKLTNDHHQL